MFGFSSKRRREPGELADIDSSTCHERKKLCPLPLRSSPNTHQKPSFVEGYHVVSGIGLSTITPVESSDDDEERDNRPSVAGRLSRATSQLHIPRTRMEIDSEGETLLSTWPTTTNHDSSILPSPTPNSLVNHSLTISERPDMGMGARCPLAPSCHHEPTPACIQDPASWQGQRLPSPISESEDGFPSSMNSVSDADMTLNISHTAPSSPAYRWQSSAHVHPRPGSVAKPRNKKPTFSMGFRADCEKCFRKVPGHYSHIIRP